MKRVSVLCCALLCLSATVRDGHAQFTEDFSDGDLTSNPAWFGTLDRWTIIPSDSGPVLRTRGLSAADTLTLATALNGAFGEWSIRLMVGGGRLSAFNQVRIFVVADTSSAASLPVGYYLMVGSNERTLRLYRSRRGSSAPTLLATGERDLLDSDSVSLDLTVRRSLTGNWTVGMNGAHVLSAREDSSAFLDGRLFALWVKHSSLRGDDYYFGSVSATPAPPVDRAPPSVQSAGSADGTRIQIRFNEPVRPRGACSRSDYVLSSGSQINRVDCPDSILVRDVAIEPTVRLTPGVHTVSTREITDATGDRSSFSSASFTVESPGQPPEPGKLIVNEVQYAPPPGSVEFVELLSLNEEPLSLSYLTLFDAQNTSGPVDTAAPPLSPGQLAVLAADSSLQHVIDSNALFLVPESWPGFTNSGDAVVVRWAGHMIDSLHYTSVGDRSGVSMERVDPRKPTSFRGNWSFSSDRTGSTPGRVNTVYSPDHVPPALVSAEALPSDAVRLTLDEPVQASAAIPGHFRVGSAGAAAVTPEDDREFPSVLRLEFPGAFESTHTRLFAAQVTDLAGNTATSLSVDVAWPPAAGELVINEIMYGPRTDPTDGRPDQPEYLELLNTTVRPLSLSECVWAGEPNEDGSADTASVAGRTPALRPGGYALLVKAADLETAEEALGDAFPGFPPQSAPLIFPISTSSAPSLRNNGDHVALLCRPSVLVDAVTYDSDWQDAGRAEASGVSLERIDPYSASTEPTNWASSLAPSGGTPGMDNSVRPVEAVPAISGDIVINEILYEPSDLGWSPRVDFIELLNRSGRPLDLNGFYVQQRAASQSAGDSTRVAYNPTILEPGGYGLFFAVPPSTPTNAGALSRLFPALDGEPPTAVILGRRRGGFSIPSRPTCLSLMSPAAIEVDYVCYDPGWHHPHLSDTRGISLERIDADNPSTAQNWTSSTDASGATPATRNSVAISGQPGESARPGLTIAPNPFSPDRDGVDDTARIEYRLVSRRALVRVRIYDSLGKRVRTLIPGRASAGSGVTLWDGLDDRQAALPVGIYVVLLDAVDSESAQTEVYKSALVLARKLG